MKHDNLDNRKLLLKRDMQTKGLCPKKQLHIDNQRHQYKVRHKGKIRNASYLALRDSFGSDIDILLCEYGLIDSKQQYTFQHHCKKQ